MTGLFILLAIAALVLIIILSGTVVWEVRHPDRRTDAYAMARSLPADPGEADLKFTEWMINRPDGTVLPVWEVEGHHHAKDETSAQSDDENDLTVLFLHGWGASRIDMLVRRTPYDAHASRMIFFDQRGHGAASGGRCTLGTREVDDALAVIDHLGPCRLLLVGHSMGGVIAISVARRLEAAGVDDASRAGVHLAGVVAYGPYTSTLVPMKNRLRTLGHPSVVLPELAFAMLWTLGVRDVTTLDDVAQVEAPLMCIVGDVDPITPVPEVRSIVEASSRGVLEVLEGVDHSDAHEKAPQDHERVVRGFLDSIVQSSTSASVADRRGETGVR